MKGIIVHTWDIITLKTFIYRNVSPKLVDSLKEQYSNYSKYLITLASSSIGLTFAILQLLSKGSHFDLQTLKISWLFFGISILLGLVFHTLEMLRSFCIQNISRLQENLKFSEQTKVLLSIKDDEVREESWRYERYTTQFVRFSYVGLILQTITFFIGVPFVVVFLLTNL